MKVTLTNNFHGTTCRVNVAAKNIRWENEAMSVFLSESQVRRARRVLCGHADCRCSHESGSRGGVRAYRLSR